MKINRKLISAFALLDSGLDRDELFQKVEGSSTMLQLLEHILFTNQILIQEIGNGVSRANNLYSKGEHKPGRYTFAVEKFNAILADVTTRKVTIVQEDLQSSPETLRLLLRDQLYRCMSFLDQLSSGQGRLVCIMLPIEGLPPMDPYQALYFLALHMQKRMSTLANMYSRTDACSTFDVSV